MLLSVDGTNLNQLACRDKIPVADDITWDESETLQILRIVVP